MDESRFNSLSLWRNSPSAGLLLINRPDGGIILELNDACLDLLGLPREELVNRPGGLDAVLDERAREKFRLFLNNPRKKDVILNVNAAGRKLLELRFLKRPLGNDAGMLLLSLQDMTEMQEDARALQAGYDEFIRVTMELEEAVATIERQKKQLEEQKRTLEKELEIAHRVQERMFNLNFDQFTSVDISGYYQAMQDLGGDMWEFHETSTELLGVLGDVMGHGVASSLISISTKIHFKKCFEDYKQFGSLSSLLTNLNNDICQVTGQSYFLTAAVFRIDLDYEMEYITCGHPPMLVVPMDPERDIQQLYTEQPMLGIFADIKYESHKYQLRPGDRVFFYTDCLIESMSPAGEPLQIEEIARVIRFGERTKPSEVIDDVLNYRNNFTASTALPDDLTLVCIEVPEIPRRRAETDKTQSEAGREQKPESERRLDEEIKQKLQM